jgi:chaperonin GroES
VAFASLAGKRPADHVDLNKKAVLLTAFFRWHGNWGAGGTATSTNHMATKVKPLADRVLVEAAAAEETTKGGLFIPDTAKEKPQRGKIIAVGTGRVADDGKVTPLTVKVGDSVLYGKYSGTELSLDGKDYMIMRESDIYAVLN